MGVILWRYKLISDRTQARIDRAEALVNELNAAVGSWIQTKEVAERGQAYIHGFHDVPSWDRKPFGGVPPVLLKNTLQRIANELSGVIDERLTTGQLDPDHIAALKAFQAGEGGYGAPFLKIIGNPDIYRLKAIIRERWVIDSLAMRNTEGQTSKFRVGAHAEFTLDIAAEPGGLVAENLDALIAELRDLLDAGEA